MTTRGRYFTYAHSHTNSHASERQRILGGRSKKNTEYQESLFFPPLFFLGLRRGREKKLRKAGIFHVASFEELRSCCIDCSQIFWTTSRIFLFYENPTFKGHLNGSCRSWLQRKANNYKKKIACISCKITKEENSMFFFAHRLQVFSAACWQLLTADFLQAEIATNGPLN